MNELTDKELDELLRTLRIDKLPEEAQQRIIEKVNLKYSKVNIASIFWERYLGKLIIGVLICLHLFMLRELVPLTEFPMFIYPVLAFAVGVWALLLQIRTRHLIQKD